MLAFSVVVEMLWWMQGHRERMKVERERKTIERSERLRGTDAAEERSFSPTIRSYTACLPFNCWWDEERWRRKLPLRAKMRELFAKTSLTENSALQECYGMNGDWTFLRMGSIDAVAQWRLVWLSKGANQGYLQSTLLLSNS